MSKFWKISEYGLFLGPWFSCVFTCFKGFIQTPGSDSIQLVPDVVLNFCFMGTYVIIKFSVALWLLNTVVSQGHGKHFGQSILKPGEIVFISEFFQKYFQ